MSIYSNVSLGFGTLFDTIASKVNLDTAMNERKQDDIKEILDTVNDEIINDYQSENADQSIVDYIQYIPQYKVTYEKTENGTYFKALTVKNVLAPLTKEQKSSVRIYVKHLAEYSNKQAVEKYNKLTGATETNSYYTRILKRCIYTNVKLDRIKSEIVLSDKFDKAVKLFSQVVFAAKHNYSIVEKQTGALDIVENVCDNPTPAKTDNK